MQKLLETLAKYGVTVPQEKEAEIKAALSQHYKNAAEVGKKIAKLELERDGYKEQAENSAETLKSFEGVDLDKIKEELENWKTKAADAQKEMEKQLYDRDFASLPSARLRMWPGSLFEASLWMIMTPRPSRSTRWHLTEKCR